MIDDRFHAKLSSKDYFSYVEVPDDWPSIEEFTEWYLGQRMPLMVPWDGKVICSDDATAMVLFRKGRYQAELYLVHPQQFVPRHSHPDMEVMTLFLAGGSCSPPDASSAPNVGGDWGYIGKKLEAGEYHGGVTKMIDKDGFALIAFQRWPIGIEPKSAAVQWRGNTAGPKQEELIKQVHPGALVTTGYADVTKTGMTKE